MITVRTTVLFILPSQDSLIWNKFVLPSCIHFRRVNVQIGGRTSAAARKLVSLYGRSVGTLAMVGTDDIGTLPRLSEVLAASVRGRTRRDTTDSICIAKHVPWRPPAGADGKPLTAECVPEDDSQQVPAICTTRCSIKYLTVPNSSQLRHCACAISQSLVRHLSLIHI